MQTPLGLVSVGIQRDPAGLNSSQRISCFRSLKHNAYFINRDQALPRAEAASLKPWEKRLGIRFDILGLWCLLPATKLFPLHSYIYTHNLKPFDQT